jgi:hypothetical protein
MSHGVQDFTHCRLDAAIGEHLWKKARFYIPTFNFLTRDACDLDRINDLGWRTAPKV